MFKDPTTKEAPVFSERIVSRLPRLDYKNITPEQELIQTEEQLLEILSPLDPMLLNGTKIQYQRTDAMILPEQLKKAGTWYTKIPKEGKTAGNVQLYDHYRQGIIGIGSYKQEDALQYVGYRIHYSLPLEKFDALNDTLEENYIEAQNNTLKYERLEEPDRNIAVHQFTNCKYRHQLVIHGIENQRHEDKAPIPQIEIEVIKPEIAEIKVPFDIESFPLTRMDPKDKKDALTQFIHNTALLLRVDDFKVMKEDLLLYASSEKSCKRAKELEGYIFSYNGVEHHPAIDLFLAILQARMTYPFDLRALSINFYQSGDKKSFETQLAAAGIQKLQESNNQHNPRYQINKDLVLSFKKEDRGISYNRGHICWEIHVPKNTYGDVAKAILKTSGGTIAEKSRFNTKIKVLHPKWYIHSVNIVQV